MRRNIIVSFIPHLIANPKSDPTRSPVTLPETTLQPRFQSTEPGQTSPPGIVRGLASSNPGGNHFIHVKAQTLFYLLYTAN